MIRFCPQCLVFILHLYTWNSSLTSKPCLSTNAERGTLEEASDSVQPADSGLEKHKVDSQISSKNIYFPHHYLQKYHVCSLLVEHLVCKHFPTSPSYHLALFKPWIPPKSAFRIKLYRQPLSVSVKKWISSSIVKKIKTNTWDQKNNLARSLRQQTVTMATARPLAPSTDI